MRPVRFARTLSADEYLVTRTRRGQPVLAMIATADRLVSRTARPCMILAVPWFAELGQLSDDVVAAWLTRHVGGAADDTGFLPGDNLEVWWLPVTGHADFQFLLTPAFWPPEEKDLAE